MSTSKEHIDFKKLQDYFDGKLNAQEMHALEMQAENDPFLYEAMEGYQNHPEGIDRVRQLKKDQKASSRSFFGSRTLTIIAVVGIVYIIALIIQPNIKEDKTVLSETTQSQEIEVIPEAIDTFVLADVEEQITPSEILKSKPQIEKSNDQVTKKPTKEDPEYIEVEEDPQLDIDPTLIPEEKPIIRLSRAPQLYQYDLAVVDYSEMERENQSINYTRYEFTGLSAEFESEDAEANRYNQETQVEVPYMEYLNTSMYYFSKAQYKKALNRYLTIIEQYPHDLNAHFYGALCYFNMKKYAEALQFFDQSLQIEKREAFIAFRQEAKWYSAKTLVKLKRTNEANLLLDEIISEGLFYVEDAILLKAKL